MSLTVSPLDRIREIGGELYLNGDVIRYRIPADSPEAHRLLEEIRRDRAAVIAVLRDLQCKPPSRQDLEANLPEGVRVVKYRPKRAPFVVAPVIVVTNTSNFFKTHLAALSRLLSNGCGDDCQRAQDILLRLADAGLELKIDD